MYFYILKKCILKCILLNSDHFVVASIGNAGQYVLVVDAKCIPRILRSVLFVFCRDLVPVEFTYVIRDNREISPNTYESTLTNKYKASESPNIPINIKICRVTILIIIYFLTSLCYSILLCPHTRAHTHTLPLTPHRHTHASTRNFS